MRNKQLGVTAIGWLILLTPFAIVGYAGVRLLPLYLNYMKVSRALDSAGSESKTNGGANATGIKASVDKHFEIDMVDYPDTKDLKVKRDGGVWTAEMNYEDEAPLFANISLHVHFVKTVKIGGGD
jgi:Domain of unknown function (DUF4845)